MEFKFDLEANKEKIDSFVTFIAQKRGKKGSLMSILHEAQETFGYIPVEVQEIVSRETNIPTAEIYGVITFYSQFSLIPKGKHTVSVCLGTACYVRGAQKIVDELEKQLSIKMGGTTVDLNYSLEATRCIGACGLAPVITISGDVYGKLEAKDVKSIVERYREV